MADINFVAVIAGALAIFFFNFIWFNGKTFFPVWWRAMGKEGMNVETSNGPSMGVVFGSTFIACLVQALVLAWVFSLIAPTGGFTLVTGFTYGLLLGVGFAAATSLGHRLFGQQGFLVWAIEIGADVFGLAIAGALLSFWY